MHDTVTGLSVDILSDDNSWNVTGTVVPEQEYNNNLAFGRQYHVIEDIGWSSSVWGELPNRNGEDMDGQNIIFWYNAYIPTLLKRGRICGTPQEFAASSMVRPLRMRRLQATTTTARSMARVARGKAIVMAARSAKPGWYVGTVSAPRMASALLSMCAKRPTRCG